MPTSSNHVFLGDAMIVVDAEKCCNNFLCFSPDLCPRSIFPIPSISFTNMLVIPPQSAAQTIEYLLGPYVNMNAYLDWQTDAKQVVLIMVGLPARGKSLISGKGTVYNQYSRLRFCLLFYSQTLSSMDISKGRDLQRGQV